MSFIAENLGRDDGAATTGDSAVADSVAILDVGDDFRGLIFVGEDASDEVWNRLHAHE
jgi:hypothetical protein